jgi:hypothetical protein
VRTLHNKWFKNKKRGDWKLKNYPFSKKAINVMLATAVALSSVATTGIALNPTKVEAATIDNSRVDALISFLDSIYDQVSVTDKAKLNVVKEALAVQPWETYAEQVAKKPIAHPTENKELLAGLMELFASTTVLDLKGKLETFRTEQKDNVDTVFGADITVDKVLTYIATIQTTYLTSLKGLDLNTMSETAIYLKFADAVVSVNSSTATDTTSVNNKLVGAKFASLVDEFEVLDVLQKVSQDTDPTGIARKVLVDALKRVQPVDPPVVVIPPVIIPDPDPGQNGHLPKGSTIVVPGKTPSGQPELTTNIPAEKVNELANLVTATNNTILVNLEIPKAGEALKAQVPANLFTEAGKNNKDAVLQIKSADASYNLPASQINVADLAAKLGVSAANVQINISVNVVEATEIKNGVKVVSKVIEFKVEAVSGDKTEPITTFSTYVERSITGDNNFNSNKSVGVKIDPDGTLVPVPTLFGDKDATFKSLTNSKYTIVENNFTFRDVDNGKNWAESYIETLANKLIIEGKEDVNGKYYAPAEEMTRAQFTVLLVRALGLPAEKYEQKFKDVKESDWFNLKGELAAATKAGIIQGKPDGRFAPNETISRTQAAVMLHRAMQLNFVNFDTKQLDQTKKVTDFKDITKIADWAKPSIEAIYQAGIMGDKPDSTFDPNGKTRRDQMAKMLGEFLISAKLMNKIK